MCLMFMVAEIVGGYLAGSLAVMTDAAHLLSDFVGFVVSLFSIWVGQWPPTKKLSFGYYRAEVLGALGSVSLIWMMTGIFVFMAVQRIISEDFTIEANTMMIVSGIGVAFNIIMGLVLNGACEAVRHAHAHSHAHAHPHAKQQRSINVRAAIIHVLGDLIQSVGVLVSAIVIKFYPQAKLIDPVCTFLFSAVVLATTVTIVRETTHVLMEGFPRHLDHSTVASRLHEIEGVRSLHGLHVWSLTTDKNALAVHLVVDPGADPEVVLRQAQKLARWELGVLSTTVQVERYCPDASRDCPSCRAPSD
ncbi:proton-coupled zinc antiporter SLC30A2-like isoform X2 [Bacillus rossius redtenbacheri]